MKRGCTQCGECLNVCPVFNLYKREEYAPKGKRLLLEPVDNGTAPEGLSYEKIFHLARLCAGCDKCKSRCARKLSTCDMLADVRSRNPHWTQKLWEAWIRQAGPLWPLAGRIATLVPMGITPSPLRSSLETARALVALPPTEPWLKLRPGGGEKRREVMLFAGCTAINARPQWIAKAEKLLHAFGYVLVDNGGFTCCGGTLHHAGQYAAQAEVRAQNLRFWREKGRPLVATFCASCKHSLEGYAASDAITGAEAAEWTEKLCGLSSLLTDAESEATAHAPASFGYHQPCHWGAKDPDMPFLKSGLAGLKKGTGLCCGMGGILKMTDPDLSADMARKCMEGMDGTGQVLTGCSGCTMQLASVAGPGVSVRHWLDVVETA